MTPLRCPHCVAELQQQPEPRLAVCPKCRGAFCDVATLKAMAREGQKTLRPEFYRKPPLSGTAPIKYLPCPVCNELM
ncbi:MAG TPA: hypothetical protein VHO25_04720, partial [Polyangiaceae bacterium]|nr:hypothetical protein [Polyangiaceae bacterium]